MALQLLLQNSMNQRGQSLIEYLILTCLISIASVGIISILSQNLRARYATISSALRGDKDLKKELESPDSRHYQIRGFDDFTESATTGRGGER